MSAATANLSKPLPAPVPNVSDGTLVRSLYVKGCDFSSARPVAELSGTFSQPVSPAGAPEMPL
jgi:hypothetical protein